MAKTPRSRNADDKVIQGKELDAYIKAEALLNKSDFG